MAFTDSVLHKRFNRLKKDVAVSYSDYHDFKRMLIEVGALGRMIDEDSTYVNAEFEYTRPMQLRVSEEDLLCLHPLFAGRFGAKIVPDAEPSTSRKPVYPYGSGLDDDDYRRMSLA